MVMFFSGFKSASSRKNDNKFVFMALHQSSCAIYSIYSNPQLSVGGIQRSEFLLPALPPLRATLHERVLKKPRSSWLKGGREERRLHEVRLHDEERSCWWDVRCKKSDVTGRIGTSSPFNSPIQKHATQGMFSLKKHSLGVAVNLWLLQPLDSYKSSGWLI